MPTPATFAAIALLSAAFSQSNPAAESADAYRRQEKAQNVVENRLFSNDGKFEASVSVGGAPVSRINRHGAVGLSFSWNFAEAWAVGVQANYAFHGTTAAFQDARDSIQDSDPEVRFRSADDFSDAWAMDWAAMASLRWMPIYGKMSLFSAAVPRFGVFLQISAGAGGFSKESAVSVLLDDTAIKPVFGLAGGVRFYVADWFSLDLAADARFFPDSYMVSVDRTAPASSGTEKTGISSITFASLAAVFSF